MNRQNHLALALVLSTTILLIGVALLAMCTRTPPLDLYLSQQAEQSLEQARKSSLQERNLSPEASSPLEPSPAPFTSSLQAHPVITG